MSFTRGSTALTPPGSCRRPYTASSSSSSRQQEAAHTTDHISGLNDEPISAAEANETALEIAATAASRYRSSDELLYSIRSLFRFAPWVRHVYVVTAGQVPSWMVDYHPQLTVVPHSALYPNQSHLPTFSSSSIEVHLHRLEGLSEHWLYFNDDVLLGSAVQPSDFYTPGTGYKVYLSHPIPRCSKGCADHQLGDGKCHKKCNVSDCQFDGGDCPYEPSGAESGRTAGSSGTLSWPPPNGASQRRALDSSYFCARGCSHHWVGDGVCDVSCGSTAACGFDAGDCGLDKLTADRLAEPPSALLELADVNSSHRISEQVTALHIDLRHVLSANASYAFTVDADADSRTVSRPSVSLQQLFSDTDGSPVSDATWLWVRSAVVSWERSWLTVLLRSQDEMQQLLHLEHARRHVRDPSNTQTQPDEPALIATVVPSPRRLQLLIRLQQGQDSSVAVQVDVLQGEEAGDDDMPAMVQASRRLLHLHSPHEQLAVRPPRLALSSLRRQSLPVEVTPVRGDGRALARATAEMRSKVRAYLHEGKDKDREPHHQSAGNASFPVRNTSSVMWPWELAIDSRLWNEAWRYAEALQAGSSTDEEQLDDLAEEKLQDGDDEAAVDEQWVQQQALRASLPSRAARSSSSRRLLDLFGDQLRTGQRVLSSAYGRKHEHRSAIAHIPHLLSRSVMNEVQQRWPAMYEATSAHRFRQGSDVQMAFVVLLLSHAPDARARRLSLRTELRQRRGWAAQRLRAAAADETSSQRLFSRRRVRMAARAASLGSRLRAGRWTDRLVSAPHGASRAAAGVGGECAAAEEVPHREGLLGRCRLRAADGQRQAGRGRAAADRSSAAQVPLHQR